MTSIGPIDYVRMRPFQTKINMGGPRVFVPDRLLRLLTLHNSNEIGGTLNLKTGKGSKLVYLPKGEIVTIGSHAKADIRIKGSAPSLHLFFNSDEDLMRIVTFTPNSVEIVSKSGERKMLQVQDDAGLDLSNKRGVPLRDGDTIRIKTIKDGEAEWLETTFRGWDPLRGAPIEEIPSKSALGPKSLIEIFDVGDKASAALAKFDKILVKGTLFEGANDLFGVFSILTTYIRNNDVEAENQDLAKKFGYGINIGSAILTICALIFQVPMPIFLAPAFFFLLGGLFVRRAAIKIKQIPVDREEQLRQFIEIISETPSSIVARNFNLLRPEEKETIFSTIQKYLQSKNPGLLPGVSASAAGTDLTVPQDVAPADSKGEAGKDPHKVES